MRRLQLCVFPVLAAIPAMLPAQTGTPRLHAHELAAYRALQTWTRPEQGGVTVAGLGVAGGYEARVLCDLDGERCELTDRTPAERTFAVLLWPRADNYTPGRLLFGNRGGRIFLGTPRAALSADWQPEPATIAAPGTRTHVNQMLLQSGESQDGTVWERCTVEPVAQTIRVVGPDGAPMAGVAVQCGSPRFPWHPGWVPLATLPVAAIDGTTDALGELQGQALPAGDLQISLRQRRQRAILLPSDLQVADGTLVVHVPAGAWIDENALDDQAWAAFVLARFAQYQQGLRQRAIFDTDSDGKGEFGLPEDALPIAWRQRLVLVGSDRFVFQKHLFQVWLPGTGGQWVTGAKRDGAGAVEPNLAERHFVAYAWPGVLGTPHARVFAVDEDGAVHWRFANDSYGGHDRAPTATDFRTARDGAVWHELPAR